RGAARRLEEEGACRRARRTRIARRRGDRQAQGGAPGRYGALRLRGRRVAHGRAFRRLAVGPGASRGAGEHLLGLPEGLRNRLPAPHRNPHQEPAADPEDRRRADRARPGARPGELPDAELELAIAGWRVPAGGAYRLRRLGRAQRFSTCTNVKIGTPGGLVWMGVWAPPVSPRTRSVR